MKNLSLILIILLACVTLFAVTKPVSNKNPKANIVKPEVVQEGGEIIQAPMTVDKNAAKEVDKNKIKESNEKEQEGKPYDKQFVLWDTYFISDKEWKDNKELIVFPAKMVNPPDPNNKMQADFVRFTNEEKFASTNWYKTKIADKKELEKGMRVILFGIFDDTGIYRSPQSEEEALKGPWFITTIVDISGIEEGIVTLSNDFKASINHIRIVTQ